jgi:hypothetical protein
MTIRNVNIESTQTTILYQSTSSYAVTTIFFCNQSAVTDCTLDVFVVPSGGFANSGTQVLKTLSLPKTETFVFEAEKLILDAGESIHAQASVDKIVIGTVSVLSIV